MNYNQTKNKLELLKTGLICLALIMVIFTSCASQNTSATVLRKLVQLQNVVQQVADRDAVTEVQGEYGEFAE